MIPLYAKAIESQQPEPLFVDPKAETILSQLEYDFNSLKVPRKTVIMVCLRAKKIDADTRLFLDKHPAGMVLHLGCGLDSRCLRINPGKVEWYDLDLPEVIELRQKFYSETECYHMIPAGVTDLSWIDQIAAQDRPTLVIGEGLFMYLTPEEVQALILKLQRTFPYCELVFDAYSRLTAKQAVNHPSIRKTGARIFWGIDDAAALEQWAPGIRLQAEWYFTQSPDIKKLSWRYRLAFRIAGLFKTAKKAHRILDYQL